MRIMLKSLDFILERWRRPLRLFKEGQNQIPGFRNSELAVVDEV